MKHIVVDVPDEYGPGAVDDLLEAVARTAHGWVDDRHGTFDVAVWLVNNSHPAAVPGPSTEKAAPRLDQLTRDDRVRSGDAGRIERREGVRSGEPCFAGTRIPVDVIRRWLVNNPDPAALLDAYPALTLADIEAATRSDSATPGLTAEETDAFEAVVKAPL